MDEEDKKTFVETKLSEVISIATSWVGHLEFVVVSHYEQIAVVLTTGQRHYIDIELSDSKTDMIECVLEGLRKYQSYAMSFWQM